jgi:hypothetical protein
MPWVKRRTPGEWAPTKKHLHLEHGGPRIPRSHFRPLAIGIVLLAITALLTYLILSYPHVRGLFVSR